MAIGWRTLTLMLAMLLAMGGAFHIREAQMRPLVMRAKAAQWALTTGWMMERYHSQHEMYRACGGDAPPCARLLGWQNNPYHLEGYVLRAVLNGPGYRIEVRGKRGSWVLEPDKQLRWEGEPVSDAYPAWWSLDWLGQS